MNRAGRSAFLALAVLGGPALAAGRGYLGVSLAVDADGMFLNPTLKSLTVRQVDPHSPAAKAGLQPGDAIVQVEGLAVAGTKADALRPYLQPEAGQATHMVLQRQNGKRVSIIVTAASREER